MNIVKAEEEDFDTINSYLEKMEMTKLNQKDFDFEPRKIYGIKIDKKVIAFICYLITIENVELEAIYVEPAFRQQNYASKLLEFMIMDSLSFNCNSVFLEVRETNVSAINLYKKNGFEIINCRMKYYGSENGLVMKKELRCNDE